MTNQFETIIDHFKHQRILIIGETYVDIYYRGFAERICREAPVPIVNITHKEYAPGAAANVATNAAKLQSQSVLLSVVGNDTAGIFVKQALEKTGVDADRVLIDPNRETIAKKRIIAGDQMLLRFDSGSTEPMRDEIETEFVNRLIDIWTEIDAVIISDYGYGIITDNLIKTLKKLQSAAPKVLVIDSKYLDNFRGVKATVVKPSYEEAVSLLGLTKKEHGEARIKQISRYKQKLLQRTNASLAVVTFDAEGALIFDREGPTYRTYADRVENPKVAGAGDTYATALTLSLSAGADIKSAAEIAAAAAKVIIKKQGTAYCTVTELHTALNANEKIITNRSQLKALVTTYKRQGKTIVFSNGCFDILHSGHVSYLNQAKSFGDILIVGVNTDESIKAFKGPDRPINTLFDRMNVLSALSSINFVVPMPEKTASELVKLVKPNIYVKGGDYTLETLPEAHIVLGYGGKVELIPTIKGQSTTGIIKRIQQKDRSVSGQIQM